MAIAIHLKLGSIKGESVVKGFEDTIEIHQVSWGASNPGSMHSATGGGTGKVSVSDVTLTHKVDASTPNVFQSVCSGTHIDKATLSFRKSGGDDALVYLKLDLADIVVSGFSWGGADGDDAVHETISLNFSQATVTYQPQDNKGAKKGGEIKGGWHIAEGHKL
jgi:type VI secretion system secreted protein Hcp